MSYVQDNAMLYFTEFQLLKWTASIFCRSSPLSDWPNKLGFILKLHLQISKIPQSKTAVWIPVNTNYIVENWSILTDSIKNVD